MRIRLCVSLAVAMLLLAACSEPSEPEQDEDIGFVRGEPSAAYLWAAGPCPPGAHCSGFVQLLFTGELRHNQFRSAESVVRTARVSAQELAAIQDLASSSALAEWIDSEHTCVEAGPTDSFQSVYLEYGETIGFAPVCDDHGRDLGSALSELSAKYFGSNL